jgi:hypothetical protein
MRTRLPKLLAAALLAGAPLTTAHAQPVQVNVDVNAAIGGTPINSIDVFYDQLAPYGFWLDDPQFGTVFAPQDASFQPYTVGHWQYTDVGMVWISTQPFSWATSHYGRWVLSPAYGRWVWIPDTTWGPSWVSWSYSGDNYGWAPLAPDFAVSFGYAIPLAGWHFCGAAHLFSPNVHRFFAPRARVQVLVSASRPIDNYGRVGGARVPMGPPAERLRSQNVVVKQTTVNAQAVGRWSPQEVQQKTERAQQNRTQVEQKNRQRVESNASLKQVEGEQPRAAAPPPAGAKETTPPAEPPRTKPEQQPGQQPTQPGQQPQRTEPGQQPTQPGPQPPTTQPPTREPGQQPTQPGEQPQRTEPQRTQPPTREPGTPPPEPQGTRPQPTPTPEPKPERTPPPPSTEPRATQPQPPPSTPNQPTPPREPQAPTTPQPQSPSPAPRQPPTREPATPPTQSPPREPSAPPSQPTPERTPAPSPEPKTPPTPPPQPTPHTSPSPSPAPSQGNPPQDHGKSDKNQ